ncbi:MAG TPA: TMEM175 family protein [Candidatus Elarobacter sp.]
MSKDRFEAFSDGVFAFAITVLILGVALPAFKTAPSEGELTRALLDLWPNVLAFVLSFMVIGIMWQNHHALFRLVDRIDRMTVFLNLALLGGTVFIPFATSTLGTYPTLRPAAFLYGITLTETATVYNLMLWHLTRSGAFKPDVTPETIRATTIAYRVGWATYTAATLIALAVPTLSFGLYLLVAGYYLIPRGIDADLTQT